MSLSYEGKQSFNLDFPCVVSSLLWDNSQINPKFLNGNPGSYLGLDFHFLFRISISISHFLFLLNIFLFIRISIPSFVSNLFR